MADILKPGLNEYRYKVIHRMYGMMAFINLTPHDLVKYAPVPTGDGETPLWVLPTSGVTAEVAVEAPTSWEAHEWDFLAEGQLHTENITGLPKFAGLQFSGKIKLLGDKQIDLSSCEWLRGRAVFCSNITAQHLGDYAKYGVHCFVPSTDASTIVRDAAGRIVGCRVLCNATRYPAE